MKATPMDGTALARHKHLGIVRAYSLLAVLSIAASNAGGLSVITAAMAFDTDSVNGAGGPGSRSTTTGTGPLVPLDVLRPVLSGTNDTPNVEVRFGHSVAVDGDWMVVGVPFRRGNNGQTYGAAFFYEKVSPSRWEQRQRILFGNGGHPRCGSSVALRGRHAVVGCPAHTSDGVMWRGRTVFFERDSATSQYGNAQSVLGDGEYFLCGSSVAIHGTGEVGTTWAVSGCPDNTQTPDAPPGTVDVFQRVAVGGAETWQRIQTLTTSNPPVAGASGYRFGNSVAIYRAPSGLVRIAVGESGYQGQSGMAHVFRREAAGGFFGLEASRTRPGGAQPSDFCGISSALGPTDWFVGCSQTSDGGRVIAFHFNGTHWNNGIEIPAPVGLADEGSLFGRSVATSLSGTTGDLWVGQPRADVFGPDTQGGRVHRFQRVGGPPTPQPLTYVPVAHWDAATLGIANEGAELGGSVAVDNSTGAAAVGAPRAQIPESWGEVIVFGANRIFANGLGCASGLPGC